MLELSDKNIRYLAMDVDGTLTDGKINMSASGEVFKSFNIKDGYAIHEILPKVNITPVIITGRTSDIVKNRAKELGIDKVFQGVLDKTEALKSVTADLSRVAFIGDDLNDLECMKAVKAAGGILGCPADAAKEVKDIADFVSNKDGGNGAVREFIDWLIG